MSHRPLPHFPYGIDVPGRELPRDYPGAARAGLTRRAVRISEFCFLVAGLAALAGMVLGIVMGIRQDFTLSPAHAHLNLLGWVTMALYGLYHRSIGRVGGWLGWTQVLAGAIGAALMSAGLGLYLQTGDHAIVPVVVVGSLMAFFGMGLFVALLVTDLMRGTSVSPPTGIQTS
jgi:hypothetical protein